jgi:hypothetical protein
MKAILSKEDFINAAASIKVEPAMLEAVSVVESRGNGFLQDGSPIILFERHKFYAFTNGKFAKTHPDICNKTPGGYGTVASQHARLQRAAALDRNAALQSASWGKFQLMGFNYKLCGFADLQSFINAMYESEVAQLAAFINFLKNTTYKGKSLVYYLQIKDFASFAAGYNGKNYAINQYDKKIKSNYIALTPKYKK